MRACRARRGIDRLWLSNDFGRLHLAAQLNAGRGYAASEEAVAVALRRSRPRRARPEDRRQRHLDTPAPPPTGSGGNSASLKIATCLRDGARLHQFALSHQPGHRLDDLNRLALAEAEVAAAVAAAQRATSSASPSATLAYRSAESRSGHQEHNNLNDRGKNYRPALVRLFLYRTRFH